MAKVFVRSAWCLSPLPLCLAVRALTVAQANDAAKKLVAKNRAKLLSLMYTVLVIQALYALGGWLRASSLFVALSTAVLQWACYGALHYAAQARYSATNELVAAGADISLGWWQYLFDVIYVTAFAQLGSLASGWFHLAFLAIPLYGLYAGFGFLRNLSDMHQQMAPQAAAENPKDKKKYRVMRR